MSILNDGSPGDWHGLTASGYGHGFGLLSGLAAVARPGLFARVLSAANTIDRWLDDHSTTARTQAQIDSLADRIGDRIERWLDRRDEGALADRFAAWWDERSLAEKAEFLREWHADRAQKQDSLEDILDNWHVEHDVEAEGDVTINGDAEEGGTLRAEAGTIEDEDGDVTLAYQWQYFDDVEDEWVNITGATASSFEIPDDQTYAGQQIRVKVTSTDTDGGSTAFESDPVDIDNVDDPLAGAVGLAGDVEEGGTITADVVGLADPDGELDAEYVWQVFDTGSNTWVDLATTTVPTYNLAGDQSLVGKDVRVVVTTTDPFGGTGRIESAGVTVGNVDDEATGSTSLTPDGDSFTFVDDGDGQVLRVVTNGGGSITVDLGNVNDNDGATTTAFQWFERSGAGTVEDPFVWSAIAGEADALLEVAAHSGDLDWHVRAVATTTDALGGTTEFTYVDVLIV